MFLHLALWQSRWLSAMPLLEVIHRGRFWTAMAQPSLHHKQGKPQQAVSGAMRLAFFVPVHLIGQQTMPQSM
jgi:hypothetical protein